MTATFLERKTTATGELFRINARGPWRSEYNTDSLLTTGCVYAIVENGVTVGEWFQEAFGHTVK